MPSLLYAFVLLSLGTIYYYHDYQSLDAHLARASNAVLLMQHERAVREYRAALRLADDPHIHKLLALELVAAGRTDEALNEFRIAERGGEPDELLPFRIANLLDTLQRADEAKIEYQKFLSSSACVKPPLDARCQAAQLRAKD